MLGRTQEWTEVRQHHLQSKRCRPTTKCHLHTVAVIHCTMSAISGNRLFLFMVLCLHVLHSVSHVCVVCVVCRMRHVSCDKFSFVRSSRPLYMLLQIGSVTITTEVGTDGTTTLSRMNLSGYAGHVTIFSSLFTIACRLVVGLGLGLALGLDLVSGW